MQVVVTGGGTIAPIDDVRYIANVSTGRFAATISEACLRQGATVRHVHAPSALIPFHRLARFNLEVYNAKNEVERLRALHAEFQAGIAERLSLVPLTKGTVADYAATLEHALRSDPPNLIVLAMAVSDFEPNAVSGKIDSASDELVIHARRTEKVIRQVRDWAPSAYIVGFKLLSQATMFELVKAAEKACFVNRVDLTVANDLTTVHEGTHVVHLVRPGHAPETLGPARDLADAFVARVFALKAERDGTADRG